MNSLEAACQALAVVRLEEQMTAEVVVEAVEEEMQAQCLGRVHEGRLQ